MKHFLLTLLLFTSICFYGQTCSQPTSATTTVTSGTTVNLSWVAPSSGSPTGYQYAVTTSATAPTSGTATTATSVTGYSISAGSTYYLHVRTNCSGTYSSWTTSSAFIPGDTCTSAINLANLSSPYTSTTAGAANNYNSCGGNAGPDLIYYIQVAAGSTLTIGQTSNSYNSVNFVGYGSTCPGNNTINCFDDDDTTTTTWTNTSTTAQTVYWVQDGYASESGSFTLSWNITVPCPVPTAVSATVSGTSANLSWTAPTTSTPTGYQYAVTTSATPPSSGTTTTTATSITGYGIAAGNTYYLHVRSNCSGSYSAWVTSATFRVVQAGDTCANAIDLGVLTSPLSSTTVGATHDYAFGCNSSSSPDIVYYINVPDGATLSIGATASSYDSVTYIRYGGSCPGTISILCYDDPNVQSNSWTNNTGSAQTVYYIQDGFSSNNSGTYTLAWSVITNCGLPSNLLATTTSLTTANLSWSAGTTGSPTGYQYALTSSSTPPSSGTATTATSVNGVAITAGNTYYLHVRTNCSGTYSNWVTYVFYSGYCTPAPASVWGNGITNFTLGTINNDSYFENAGYGNYTSQVVNVGQGSTQTFSTTFDYTGNAYNTKIWVDWNNDLDFDDAGENIYTGTSNPNLYPATLTGSITIPSTATLGNHRIRIGSAYFYTPTPCYTGDYGSYEDYTINVTAPCNAPRNVTATAPTTTTANLSWAAPTSGSPTSYQYAVTASSTPPTTGTTTTATSINNYSVTYSGSYYLHVRSNCSGTFSDWVSYQFTTGYCTPTTQYSFGQGITNFTLGTINNTTGAETNYYGNYTTQVANVGQGSEQTFSTSLGYTGNTYNVVIWVDWNNDLDFDDSGETIYSGSSVDTYPGPILPGSFVVPAAATLGNHRLRVGSTYFGYTLTPCSTDYYGSYEDYTINVTTPCAAPTGPTATSTTTTSANVSWTAPATGTPSAYQYAVTTSAMPPATGESTTGTSITSYGVTAGNMYYLHVRSNCNGTYSNWVTSAPFQAGGLEGDSCATAINLATLTSPYSSSTASAYNNLASPCYGETSSADLVYYINVPVGGTLTISQTYGSYNSLDYLGYGGACPGETQINCYYQNSGTANSNANIWTNNTGTEQTVYWVQDGYYSSGSFTLTWSLNVPCGLPSAVVGTATSGIAANLTWAAPTTNTPSGYQYAVTTSATPPSSGTATSATTVTGYTITSGTTYYLHVRSTCSGANSAWVTSAGFTSVASGDTCSTSIDLGSLTSPYSSTTATATNNYSFDCGGEGNDQVYFINVPNNATLTIGQTVNAYDSIIYVGYGGTCPGATAITCFDEEDTDVVTWTNTTGSTKKVFWVQDGFYPGGGTYTLAWSLSTDVPCATPAPTASSQSFCNGTTVASLTATGTTLKWYAAATGGTALATTTQLASGTYYVSQTLNNCEGARAAVAVTVNTTPAPTASAQSFCNGATLSNLTAVGTGLQWYLAATGGTALAANTVLTSRTYYVSQTLNSCESTRASVVVTINTTPAPTVLEQTFCSSATVANLSATGTGLKWYSAATGGTALLATTALSTGRYYVSQTINSCESARTGITVTVNTTPAPTASAQTFCNGATVANLDYNGTAVKWYAAATGGTALATTATLSTGTYYVSQTLNLCESARTSVAVTVNTTAAPTASAQSFCPGSTVSNLTATGTGLKWYTTVTGGTALTAATALTTRNYYVSQTLNSCESTRTSVAVTIGTVNAPTASAQTFCTGATVASLTATGTALQWYSTATGGTALIATATLATGTYYVSQTINACESTRTSVAVTVNNTTAPTASAQTFCNSATVANLAATGTALKWYTTATGGTALATTATLATGTYYVSQTLNSCESTRTSVAVTVNTTTAPTALAQTFCPGATVSNLIAVGAGLQWYTAATGGTPLASTATLTTRTYYVSQTLNSCESTRTSVAVTINTTPAPTASAQTFCVGTTVASLTAAGTGLQWYTTATGGTALAATATLATGTYYVSQTLNSCEGVRASVAVTINTTIAPTAAAQTFCNGATVSNLVASGTAIQWYDAATGGTALTANSTLSTGAYYVSQTLNACESARTAVAITINTTTTAPTASAQTFCNGTTVSSLTASGSALKWYTTATGGVALTATATLATGTYYVSQTLNSCESARVAVAVTINTTPAPTASAQAFCTGATAASLTATGTGLQWYTAATGGTAIATTAVLTTRTYYVSQTLNTCEGTRTAVAVTINTTPAPTASAQTFCVGTTVASLTAAGTGLQWYSTATGGTALAATATLANGNYYVSQTLNTCEGPRATVAVTINTTAAPTASAQTFCNGTTVASLVASGTSLQWYANATGGTALAATATLATGTYYVSQTLNTCESVRTAVTVTINTTAAPTASAQIFCNGVNVSSLTANGTDLKWYTAATGGTALATSATLSSGTYYVSQTLNSCESTRTSVVVTINTTPAPTATAQTFCVGTTVASLTATGTAVQWYTAATGGTALASTTTLATGTYYASQTLNSCEGTRTAVAVTINTTQAPTATAQTFCNGTTTGSLVASGTSLQWYATATGGTALTATDVLATGTYYVSQTLNTCESVRTAVSVTINPVTPAPTASAQTFCAGATLSSLTATGTGLQWYANATGGTALASAATLATGTYYVSQTLNTCESTRTAVAVIINTTPAPVAAAQAFCNSANVANLTATGTSVQWYTAATGGTALASTASLSTGTYYASQTLNSCEGVRTAVSVTINVTAAPTATAQTFCNSALVANLTATGTGLQWYTAATGGTALASTASVSTGTYYVSQTLNTCESTRTAVTVTVNVTAAPTASAQTFCNGTTVSSLVASGTALKWYAAATGGTALASTATLATGTYYVSQTLNNCEGPRASVAVTINTTPAPTASAQTFCAGATVTSLTATGTDVKWYAATTGGTVLASTATLATGTYYVSQTLNTCESVRTAVSVTINTTVAPTASAQTFCNSATVADLTATGTGLQWYTAATGGTALATTASLSAGTYYVSQTLNSCEGPRASVVVTINTTLAPVASAQTFCNGTTAASLVASGTALKWYTVATGGTALASTTTLATGTYYVSQTLNNCEGPRASVAVTINTTPAPAALAQTFCTGATVTSLTATGTDVKWYSAATGGTALASTATLATGTYYVTQTLNACESVRAAVSITINTTPAPVAVAQAFCNSATVAELTITGTNIQWYAAATGGTALADTSSLSTGTYYVTETLNACESTRTAVAVTVTVVTAPTASAQTYCAGATAASLVASGTALKWYAAATGGTALASTTTLATGTYYVSQTLNNCEGPRALVAVTINTTPAPTASAQTFCAGATVTSLTATGTDVKWYSAATGGTALASTATLATGTYYVTQTLNACESVRAAVSITINTTPAPVAVAQAFCNSATVAELTITGTNIQWYAAATGGTALADTASLSTGTYYVTETLNACESTSTAVAVTVTVVTAPTASAQTHCAGTTVAGLTATGTGLLWYADETGGTALATTEVLESGTYYVSETVNSCESTRAAVSVTINTTPAPTAEAQTYCGGATAANLEATGTGLIWYDVATGGTALADTATLATGTYYVSQTLNACESVRTAVSITINTTPAPVAVAQAFCNSATVAELTITGTNIQWYAAATGGTALADTASLSTGTYYVTETLNACESTSTAVAVTVTVVTAPTASAQTHCAGTTVAGLTATGTGLLWYADETGGTALATTEVLESGTYYVSETVNSCESTRAAVSVTINTTPAPTAEAQTYCGGATAANLEATGTGLIWYDVATGGTALADTATLATGTYYVSQTLNACESVRTAVSVTINTTPALTVDVQGFCTGATVAELIANGTAVQWYDVATGGTTLPDTALLSTGTYYVTQTINACESVRTAVTVTITTVTAPVADAQTHCAGTTVADLIATGTGLIWYADETGNTILTNNEVLETGTYYVSQSLNSCESTRVAVSVTINTTPAPTGDVLQTVSVVTAEDATIEDIVTITGENIVWYATEADATAGTALPAGTVLTNGTTYYATQTVNGCTSQETLAVTINVVLDVKQVTKDVFKYYPNPVDTELTIESSNMISNIEVYDLHGKLVLNVQWNKTSGKLNMSTLQAASYTVRVTTGNVVKELKILKK